DYVYPSDNTIRKNQPARLLITPSGLVGNNNITSFKITARHKGIDGTPTPNTPDSIVLRNDLAQLYAQAEPGADPINCQGSLRFNPITNETYIEATDINTRTATVCLAFGKKDSQIQLLDIYVTTKNTDNQSVSSISDTFTYTVTDPFDADLTQNAVSPENGAVIVTEQLPNDPTVSKAQWSVALSPRAALPNASDVRMNYNTINAQGTDSVNPDALTALLSYPNPGVYSDFAATLSDNFDSVRITHTDPRNVPFVYNFKYRGRGNGYCAIDFNFKQNTATEAAPAVKIIATEKTKVKGTWVDRRQKPTYVSLKEGKTTAKCNKNNSCTAKSEKFTRDLSGFCNAQLTFDGTLFTNGLSGITTSISTYRKTEKTYIQIEKDPLPSMR
ncbi:MAG: hypothetical protein HY537_18965, partial [Deltaproteobacteria bacterium]|nr:hypothetical protein [Deltaproteobacteria bacterium]